MTQEALNHMDTSAKQIVRLYELADDKTKDMIFALADIIVNATKELSYVTKLDLTQPEQKQKLQDIILKHEISDAWKPFVK